MKMTNQPKGTALGRRRFLLKSAGVAGVLTAPTLSRAGFFDDAGKALGGVVNQGVDAGNKVGGAIVDAGNKVVGGDAPILNPPGIKSPQEIFDEALDLIPDEIRYATNPVHINTIKATDDPVFYKLMESIGVGGWDICEASWQNSQDAMTKFGYLSFINERNTRFEFGTNPFGGNGSMRKVRDIKAKYKFNFHEFYNQGGYKDLDRIKIDKVNNDGTWFGNTSIVNKTFKPELRRKLQSDPGWGQDWQIPDSWQSEFELWATSIDIASRYPVYGVFVMQYGDRERYGLALRVMYVYRYRYERVGGNWVRRVLGIRRIMYLFGAYIEVNGTEVWRNFAIDMLHAYQIEPLNRIAQALWNVAARQRILNGMPPAQIRMEWPPMGGMPVFHFPGWHGAMLEEQHEANRAEVIAAVYALVREGRDAAVFVLAAENMQDAMRELANDQRNWPRNIGVVPLRAALDFVRIDNQAVNVQQPVIDGVQWNGGNRPVNFSPVNLIIPALNNFWLDDEPIDNLNHPIPEGVLPYQAGAGVVGIVNPPNVEAGRIFPEVVPPNVPMPNGINQEDFNRGFIESLAGSSLSSGGSGIDAAVWMSINN